VRRAWGVLVCGTLVLVAIPAWWLSARTESSAGSLDGLVDRRPATDTVRRSHPFGGDVIRAGQRVVIPTIEVHSARLSDLRQPRMGPAPVGIVIPGIGLEARVVRVGVDGRTGGVEVPPDVRTVGWYRFSPVPGERGSSVLLGHVDSSSQGPGAFFHLVSLEPGSEVRVLLADRSSRTFRVVARRSYLKSRLPAMMFARTGRPMLVLVTCGGPFNAAIGHYRDNVVVYAVPMGGVRDQEKQEGPPVP
jgi:sortase (surface protein transpeptidase)